MKTITVVLALVLLAGCGQPAERTYRPGEEPAPATGAARAEPAPSATDGTPSASESGRPASAEVGDLQVRFDWPDEDSALLRLFPAFYVGKYEAVISGDDGFLRHVELEYRVNAIRWARAFTDEGKAVAGRSRLFGMKVNAIVGRGAEVDVCVDETDMKVVSADTGEPVSPQPTSIRKPYLQRVLARKGDDGVWRIKQIGYGKEGCSR